MSIRPGSAVVNALGSVIAVIIALLVGAIVIVISGHDPWEAYKGLVEGALGSRRGRAETLVYAAPLILGGLAFTVAARAGMFNIGIEGQLMMGGFAAALVGATDLGMPKAVHLPLALVAAILIGGFWGMIPGALKAATGAHEVITTIMLNYIAFRIITYSIQKQGDWLPVDPQVQGTDKVLPTARLPILLEKTRLHSGVLIAVVAAFVIWFVLFKTSFGYKIRTVGLSRGAALYGGMHWGLTITVAMAIAGALAGLAGAGESLGLHGRQSSVPPGLGFTAIAVGLVGRNNPIGVIFSGLLFGFLGAGSLTMQARADVSKEIVFVLQGLVILAVAAFEAISRLSWFRARTTSTRPPSSGASNTPSAPAALGPRPAPPAQ